MNTSEALMVADKLTRLARHIGISGGEPLVRDDIMDIMAYIAERAESMSMQSNLILMDYTKAKALADMGLRTLYTSLDGPSPIYHEALRGEGTWRALMRGIRIIKKAGLKFSTVTTINSLNWKVVDKTAKLSETLGASAACFIPIVPIGRARGKGLMPTPRQMREAVEKLRSIASELSIPIVLWCAPFAIGLGDREIYVSPCTDKGLDVDPMGRVLLCDTMDIQISDMRKTVDEITWDLKHNEHLILAANRRPDPCSSCPYYEFCKGGCVARSYLVYGKFDAPDPLCPIASGVTEEKS